MSPKGTAMLLRKRCFSWPEFTAVGIILAVHTESVFHLYQSLLCGFKDIFTSEVLLYWRVGLYFLKCRYSLLEEAATVFIVCVGSKTRASLCFSLLGPPVSFSLSRWMLLPFLCLSQRSWDSKQKKNIANKEMSWDPHCGVKKQFKCMKEQCLSVLNIVFMNSAICSGSMRCPPCTYCLASH